MAIAGLIIGETFVTAPAVVAQEPPAPALSVGDLVVYEGDGLGRIAVTLVTLDRPHTEDVTVQFATVDGTAVAGLDFNGAAGSIVIPAGATQRNIAVAIRADKIVEDQLVPIGPNAQYVYQDFFVEIAVSTGGVVLDRPTGRVEIRDSRPGLTIDDVQIVEGDDGPRHYAVLSIYLDRPATERITGFYTTTNAGDAQWPGDFRQSGGSIELQPGQVRQRVRVPIVADLATEGDETFEVTLHNLSPAANVQDDEALVTIVDDD
jgi:hypothetical protein